MNTSTYNASYLSYPLICRMAQVADVQLSLMRSLFETQAKMAALYGAPDLSGWFAANGDVQPFEQGVSQVVNYNERMFGALLSLQTPWSGFIKHRAEASGTNIENKLTKASDFTQRVVPIRVETQRMNALQESGEAKARHPEEPKDAAPNGSEPISIANFICNLLERQRG